MYKLVNDNNCIQEFSDLSNIQHFVAIGRVPGPIYSAVQDFMKIDRARGMAVWHPHFGKFEDQSLDLRMFLKESVHGRPIIKSDQHAAALNAIMNARDITLLHAISGDNTLERIAQLQEFAHMLLHQKMTHYEARCEEDVLDKPPFLNVILTKGYGDRNDIDFSELKAENNNPNTVSIRAFARQLKMSGVKRLFFTEPHSFQAMQHMADVFGSENVCFPTLSRQFTDYILSSDILYAEAPEALKNRAIAGGAPDGGGKWLDTGEIQASLIRTFSQIMALHGLPQDDIQKLNNWRSDPFMQEHFLLFDKVREDSGHTTTQLIHGNVSGKIVVLVDDVSVTGRTMAEAARLAYENGAVAVAVCLAHSGFIRYQEQAATQKGFNNALDHVMDIKRPDGSGKPLITQLFVGGTVPSFYHHLPQWVKDKDKLGRIQIVDVDNVAMTALGNLHDVTMERPAQEYLDQITIPGEDKQFTIAQQPVPLDDKECQARPVG